MNSYKQKKLEEFMEKFCDQTISTRDGIITTVLIFKYGPEIIKQFISSLIDETEKEAYDRGKADAEIPLYQVEKGKISKLDITKIVLDDIKKQAQLEMREDLEKKVNDMWENSFISEQSRNDLINYLNKIK